MSNSAGSNLIKSFYKQHLTQSGNIDRVMRQLINSFMLKVQSCKSHKNKYMIASTQITNTEMFAFIAILAFKLLSRNVLVINRKKQWKQLKSRLRFKKIANFTDKLLQNYK